MTEISDFLFQGGLKALLECIKEKDPDKVSVGLASSLDTVAELELLQVSLVMLGFAYRHKFVWEKRETQANARERVSKEQRF